MIRIAALVAATWLLAGTAQAQILYGSIVGNVKDTTGAVIPDAAVSAKETATGFTRQTHTNESGQFQFPTVPGGVYEITISKAGFATFSTKDVGVSPNSIARVDAALEVGAVTESIRVEAAPPALQTDRSEVRTEISARQFANAPLPPGSGSDTFRKVWSDRLLPAIDAFRPQLVMISAGFDAHYRDPLAQIELESDDYRWITQSLVAIADRHAQGRVVSMLEGGYDLSALGECSVAHVGALIESR